MMPSAKQGKSNNPPPSPFKDSLDALGKLIEDNFASLEARMVSIEDQINKRHEQFFDIIKDIKQKANSALSLATFNSKVIAENTEKISSQQFDYQSLVERIEALEIKNKELTDELEDSKNRTMRKTLYFRNIRQPQQRESWDQTKQTLASEILNVMPELDRDFIISKIERAHRAKGNNYGSILSVIAKFSDWTFTDQVKSSFIRAAKDKKDQTPIIVSQMYLAALTKRRNNAMIKSKELVKDDHRIQAYVKYPAVLMVKYPGQPVYTSYAEYLLLTCY